MTDKDGIKNQLELQQGSFFENIAHVQMIKIESGGGV